MDLKEYKKKIANLSVNEQKLRDLYLRDMALGKVQGPPTGYASIDKPWLKYYSEEQIMSNISDMTIYEYLKLCNKDNLHNVALRFFNQKITYEELFEKIDQTARSLVVSGVKSGDTIVAMLPTSPEEVFLFYAVSAIGANINYVFPNTPEDKLCDILNEFNVKKFFCFDGFNLDYDSILRKTTLDTIVNINFMNKNKLNDNVVNWYDYLANGYLINSYEENHNPFSLLFIAKTGGTTGKPKNVLLNDASFNSIIHQYKNSSLNYNKGDSWLRLWPIFSATAAVSSNHLPLCMGMELILRPFENVQDFDKILLEEKPNHIPLVPAFLEVLMRSDLISGQDLSFLKSIGFGGAGTTKEFEESVSEFFKKHNANLYLGSGYGMTENASVATVRMSDETAVIGATGVPLVNTIVASFNPDTMDELSFGDLGELCIKSPNFMMGYYNDIDLTNSVIKKHKDGTMWIHSGDLGFVSQDGQVFVKDRMRRMIQTYPSDKVYPSELEEVIDEINGVFKSSVVAFPDVEHSGFSVPVSFVILEEGYDAKDVYANIMDVTKNKFPSYAQIKEIYFRDSFPLTSMGKTDTKTLEKELIKSLKK